jgi:hypothetical protein
VENKVAENHLLLPPTRKSLNKKLIVQMNYQKSNISECEELRHMLPEYAVGALNSEENDRVKALLEKCPEMREELNLYFALTTAFYDRIDPVEPPKALHDKLLSKIRASNGRHTYSSNGKRASSNRPEHKPADESEIRSLRNQCLTLADYLSAHDLHRVLMVDSQNAPVATLIWRPNTLSAVLTSTNFPRIQSVKNYHLWLIAGEQRTSAGIFNIDENGFVLFNLLLDKPVDRYQQVLITLEDSQHANVKSTPIAQGEIGVAF